MLKQNQNINSPLLHFILYNTIPTIPLPIKHLLIKKSTKPQYSKNLILNDLTQVSTNNQTQHTAFNIYKNPPIWYDLHEQDLK